MSELLRLDRPWSEYPLGTKAHAITGGYWIKVPLGWKWHNGATFPTPGGDACGCCVELPMSESQTPSGYRYTVFYGGGIGPDVWDAERVVYAVDIKDALAQCGDITDDGGWIISVEQSDYPQPTTKDQLAKVESELTATRARLAELEGITERLYQAAKSGHVTSAVALDLVDGLIAYEAYKEGKK